MLLEQVAALLKGKIHINLLVYVFQLRQYRTEMWAISLLSGTSDVETREKFFDIETCRICIQQKMSRDRLFTLAFF